MKIKSFYLIALLAFFVSCNEEDKNEKNDNLQTAFVIQPPIKNADIPFNEYSVDAEKGDTIFYHTGSIILFPPNSFVDKKGNEIKGNVKVKYREFSNPIDFYLSGIPMSYDSSGKQYTFESAGMCEILAYKDSLPVFVNPKSKPEINIATQNSSQEQNLYYLDTTQKKWINKETSIVTDLNKKSKDNKVTIPSTFTEITEPLKPEKANNKSPVIKIEIDPASFKELLVYDNLQFQLDPNEKNFNPKDTSVDWSKVELEKGSSKGLYTVKFSNSNRTVSYAARPVLEGNDYDKALKIFDKKNKEYLKKLNERLTAERINKKQYVKDSIAYLIRLEENKRIERLNALIEIRNKEVEKLNSIIEAKNIETEKRNAIRKKEIEVQYRENEKRNAIIKKEIEAHNRETEKRNAIIKKEIEAQNRETEKRNAIIKKESDEYDLSSKLLRSFEIDGFGIWNCDNPILLKSLPIIATFKGNKGNSIEMTNVAVLYKSFNGILKFNDNKIKVVKDASNMIIGVCNGKFAYITYNEYDKLKVNTDTKAQTFTMTIVEDKDNNYDFIKTVAGRQ